MFVLGQEPNTLTAVYEIHMKTVSGSLYSDASLLHRFRYLFHFKNYMSFKKDM